MKQMNVKGSYSKGDARPSNFGYSHSGGAEIQYKPKSGSFVCGNLNHKAFSCPLRTVQHSQ